MFHQSLITVADLLKQEEFKRREKWQELLNLIAVNVEEKVANSSLKASDVQQKNVLWRDAQLFLDNMAILREEWLSQNMALSLDKNRK